MCEHVVFQLASVGKAGLALLTCKLILHACMFLYVLLKGFLRWQPCNTLKVIRIFAIDTFLNLSSPIPLNTAEEINTPSSPIPLIAAEGTSIYISRPFWLFRYDRG